MEHKTFNYNFSSKKDKIKNIFDTPDYQEYKENKRKIQKRKENIYKVTSIGNSTNVIKYLILANIIIYVLSFLLLPINNITYYDFALYNFSDSNFRIWQIVTTMFLHSGIIHLLFNMIALWSIGNSLNNTLTDKKLLELYFISGLFSSILHATFNFVPAVGASGAICGLLSAMSVLYSDTKVKLFFIIPINLRKFTYGFTIFSFIFGILSIFNPMFSFGIAHFGHLGGLLTGFALMYYWKYKANTRNINYNT